MFSNIKLERYKWKCLVHNWKIVAMMSNKSAKKLYEKAHQSFRLQMINFKIKGLFFKVG